MGGAKCALAEEQQPTVAMCLSNCDWEREPRSLELVLSRRPDALAVPPR